MVPDAVRQCRAERFVAAAGRTFLGARANANNNTRDAVGSTSTVSAAASFFEVPTLWRKVTGGFTVAQLQTAFRPAPLNNLRQPGAALDINENGTIVGFTRVGSDRFNRAAILHENQDPDILRLFGASDILFRLNEARGISNNGYITGIATRIVAAGPGGVQTRGFVRSPGGTIRGTLIPDINGTFIGSFAHKVNDSGFAVGRLLKNDGGTAAALWNADGEVALLDSSNVDDLPPGAVLTDALEINDHGAILAKGFVNGELHVFILRFRGTFLIFKSASQSVLRTVADDQIERRHSLAGAKPDLRATEFASAPPPVSRCDGDRRAVLWRARLTPPKIFTTGSSSPSR